jgi:hypothetical protein
MTTIPEAIKWSVEEVADAIVALDHDATNFGVIYDDIKADPKLFAESLLPRLEAELERLIEREGRCHECREEYQVFTKSECVGYYGSAKAYEDVGYRYCATCRREE